ncbi:methyltransferase type 11 [Marasmius fiardii PR-910]|nr:methyltransferase type 11 [Marasmius fiardii PR-910]
MTTAVHDIAAQGFGKGTNELYNRARPSYPREGLSHIQAAVRAGPPYNIVEIGAGSGIFTRALLSHPDWNNNVKSLQAVEPSFGMRDVFAQTVKDDRVSVHEGTFDATGVEDGWADIIVIAQAFHWCPDYGRASVEFARILKPNGVVAFIWNLEDRDAAEWVAKLRNRIEQHEKGSPQFRLGLWREAFDTPSYRQHFDAPEEKTWRYNLPGTTDVVVDRACSKKTLFAKSDQLSVSSYADLPIEVSQILRNADFIRELYSGEIDTVTGFALVTSAQTCFVWQHSLAIKGIPTCYILPCPWDYNQTSPPFHCLVPYSSGREPGLILVSTIGEIRFWDSIGIGLAGGDRYTTTQLGITSEELVTNLIRVDQQTYVASTTSGSLFRLILTSTGGKYHITSRIFSKPAPQYTLTRLIPSIFSQSSSTSNGQIGLESGNVSALALGAITVEGGREIWALVDSRVQKWDMKLEGWEEVVFDEDIAEAVRSAVRRTFGDSVEEDDAKLDLELVDLAVDGANKLVVLVSYAGKEQYDIMAMDVGSIKRIYILVQLSLIGSTFKSESVRGIPYQSTSSSGAPMHPRIQLLPDGLLVSIQFGDAVALCARESDYQERLELKSASDRTFGVGVMQSDSVVLVLTAATMMQVNVNVDTVLTFDSEMGRAELIKSIMTQAILYGSLPNNPLHFSFPPDVDEESLMQGAEQLSEAVLHSDLLLVRGNQDLTSQLKGRKERLNWLIQFINDNLVLQKMSQACRQNLLMDAEKLTAALDLWSQHNLLLTETPSHSVLNDAVYLYMSSLGEGAQDDYMRAFFRTHVGVLGDLIKKIPDITLNAAQETNRGVAELLPEANSVLLTVLNSAFRHRGENAALYGIELPMVRSWTSEQEIIDGVLALFDTSTRIVESSPERTTVKTTHLSELATALFNCIQERLDWLGGVGIGENNHRREYEELKSKFDHLRPEVLETLRRNGEAENAFRLAEQYRDFSSLADLCHREVVYPPEDNPNAARIQTYVDHFKEEFTTELYHWYIQHGELRIMFAQETTHNEYLDKYFAENPNASISWIHDLGSRRHEAAASALYRVSSQEANLKTKHLMLSIGKLSQLAHIQESEEAEDSGILDAFHDDLDFVSVHESLLDEIKGVLSKLRGKRSLDTQVETVIKERATTLLDRTELVLIFKNLVRDLLQGKNLSIEDAVDVLTLKDNKETPQEYATALQLLTRSRLPEARKLSTFRTVWRRVYIHDDWDAIRKTTNVSDAELQKRFKSTALYNTLLQVLPRGDDQEGYETVPDVALIIPTTEEVASRWPGMPQDQVERLIQDYSLECDKLGDLDLNDEYHRVRELAEEDLAWNRLS